MATKMSPKVNPKHATGDDFNPQPEIEPTGDGQPEHSEPPNPFDPAKYRLNLSGDLIGSTKVIVNVPVMRPKKQDFIRVHPGKEYRFETAILDLEQDGESFLVDAALHSLLAHELRVVTLFTAITRAGLLFLWPVRLPDPSGRRNAWNETALAGARLGMSTWIRVVSNRSAGQYDILQAAAKLPEPEWPKLTFPEILQKAFRSDAIETVDHPALRRLAGRL